MSSASNVTNWRTEVFHTGSFVLRAKDLLDSSFILHTPESLILLQCNDHRLQPIAEVATARRSAPNGYISTVLNPSCCFLVSASLSCTLPSARVRPVPLLVPLQRQLHILTSCCRGARRRRQLPHCRPAQLAAPAVQNCCASSRPWTKAFRWCPSSK